MSPSASIKGLTFFPVPVVDDVRMAFGASLESYFDRRDLPTVPSKWTDMANALFFNGGELPKFDDRVDANLAGRAIAAWLRSWGPSHESKESTVGYALWLWTDSNAIDEALAALAKGGEG